MALFSKQISCAAGRRWRNPPDHSPSACQWQLLPHLFFAPFVFFVVKHPGSNTLTLLINVLAFLRNNLYKSGKCSNQGIDSKRDNPNKGHPPVKRILMAAKNGTFLNPFVYGPHRGSAPLFPFLFLSARHTRSVSYADGGENVASGYNDNPVL
jgi:hypothetical protein